MEVYPPGLSLHAPAGADRLDSVMARFARQGVPVINLARAKSLAREYDFPLAPAQVPPVGVGDVFVRSGHSRWLAGAVLLSIFAVLQGFVLSDMGYRIRSLFWQPKGLGVQAGSAASLACVETGPQLMV